jgi:hypothetical protein
MDWASVVSIAITGIVGIAGVAGTIVSARLASKSATKDLKLSISAENDRADKAEKRRIYAAFLAAADEMVLAESQHRLYYSTDDQVGLNNLATEQIQATHTMYEKVSELFLIAPPDVSKATQHIVIRSHSGYGQGV